MTLTLTRRRLLRVGALGAGSALIAGCDAVGRKPAARNFLQRAEDLTMAAQRALIDRTALAPEFSESDIIQPQRPNGSTNVQDAGLPRALRQRLRRLDAAGHRAGGQAAGAVARRNPQHAGAHPDHPPRLRGGLELHRQVDRRAAVDRARPGGREAGRGICRLPLLRHARAAAKYYESIDMIDARHPQTILAYGLNDETLADPQRRAAPRARGAPARLQDGEIHQGDRGGRQLRADRPRQGRLLAGPRLRMVTRGFEGCGPRPSSNP